MVLLCYSMAEFFFNHKILWYAIKYSWTSVATSADAVLAKRGKRTAFLERQAAKENDESAILKDFATKEQQISPLVWIFGCIAILVVTMIIMEAQLHVNAGLGLLASILAIIFSFMSIHGAGVTDFPPLTASSKASQLVFGGVTHGQPQQHALKTNLLVGAMASAGADMSTTLTGDFRTGFLLRTPPNLQFYAQAVGTFVAMFLAPGKEPDSRCYVLSLYL